MQATLSDRGAAGADEGNGGDVGGNGSFLHQKLPPRASGGVMMAAVGSANEFRLQPRNQHPMGGGNTSCRGRKRRSGTLQTFSAPVPTVGVPQTSLASFSSSEEEEDVPIKVVSFVPSSRHDTEPKSVVSPNSTPATGSCAHKSMEDCEAVASSSSQPSNFHHGGVQRYMSSPQVEGATMTLQGLALHSPSPSMSHSSFTHQDKSSPFSLSAGRPLAVTTSSLLSPAANAFPPPQKKNTPPKTAPLRLVTHTTEDSLATSSCTAPSLKKRPSPFVTTSTSEPSRFQKSPRTAPIIALNAQPSMTKEDHDESSNDVLEAQQLPPPAPVVPASISTRTATLHTLLPPLAETPQRRQPGRGPPPPPQELDSSFFLSPLQRTPLPSISLAPRSDGSRRSITLSSTNNNNNNPSNNDMFASPPSLRTQLAASPPILPSAPAALPPRRSTRGDLAPARPANVGLDLFGEEDEDEDVALPQGNLVNPRLLSTAAKKIPSIMADLPEGHLAAVTRSARASTQKLPLASHQPGETPLTQSDVSFIPLPEWNTEEDSPKVTPAPTVSTATRNPAPQACSLLHPGRGNAGIDPIDQMLASGMAPGANAHHQNDVDNESLSEHSQGSFGFLLVAPREIEQERRDTADDLLRPSKRHASSGRLSDSTPSLDNLLGATLNRRPSTRDLITPPVMTQAASPPPLLPPALSSSAAAAAQTEYHG